MRFWRGSLVICIAILSASSLAGPAHAGAAEALKTAKSRQLAQIIASDHAKDGLQSTIFGAWSGKDEILTTALGPAMGITWSIRG